MVDFNNQSTVSTPPGDVVKIVVLERREQVIEAIEQYYSVESAGLEPDHKVNILRARIMAFWNQIQAMVKRKRPAEYEEIRQDMSKAQKFVELVQAYEWMNEFVDEDLGLTQIDTRERYDRRRVEDVNSKKGL